MGLLLNIIFFFLVKLHLIFLFRSIINLSEEINRKFYKITYHIWRRNKFWVHTKLLITLIKGFKNRDLMFIVLISIKKYFLDPTINLSLQPKEHYM